MHLKMCRCSGSVFQEGGQTSERGTDINCNCLVFLRLSSCSPPERAPLWFLHHSALSLCGQFALPLNRVVLGYYSEKLEQDRAVLELKPVWPSLLWLDCCLALRCLHPHAPFLVSLHISLSLADVWTNTGIFMGHEQAVRACPYLAKAIIFGAVAAGLAVNLHWPLVFTQEHYTMCVWHDTSAFEQSNEWIINIKVHSFDWNGTSDCHEWVLMRFPWFHCVNMSFKDYFLSVLKCWLVITQQGSQRKLQASSRIVMLTSSSQIQDKHVVIFLHSL